MVNRWGQVRRSLTGGGEAGVLAIGADVGGGNSSDMKLATLASVAAGSIAATTCNQGRTNQGRTTTFVPT